MVQEDEMSNGDYLIKKLTEYCDTKTKRGEKFNMYDMYTDNKDHFWNFTAAIYGFYMSKNSNLETVELSKQEW